MSVVLYCVGSVPLMSVFVKTLTFFIASRSITLLIAGCARYDNPLCLLVRVWGLGSQLGKLS